MNVFHVEPGKAQVIPFSAPQAGIIRGRVQTSAPANVFIVDASGRQQYAAGEQVMPLWQSQGGQMHELNLPLQIPWFLVIENPGKAVLSGVYSVITPLPSMGPTGMAGPQATGGWGRGGWGGGGWGTGGWG